MSARVRRRTVCVRQNDGNDCGAACLASVAAFYGRRLPLARIHHLAASDRSGTNVLGLVQAASQLGFLAKGVRGTPEALPQVPLPAIAHVVFSGQQHFVVVYEVGPRGVLLMDPEHGELRRMAPEAFAAAWSGVLVLLSPGEAFRPGDERVAPMRRIWGLMRPHGRVLLQALAGAVAYTLLGLSTAVYLQKIVDHVLPGGNQNLLNVMSLAMLVIAGLQAFLGVSQELLLLGVGRHVDGALIVGYYRHILQLPHRFFLGRRVGDLLSRVTDAAKVRAFVSAVALKLVLNALVLVLSLALAFVYSWRLALLLAGVLLLYAVTFAVVDRLNGRNQRVMMERNADLQAWLVESVEGIATVRHFGMEEYASLQTETRLVRLLRAVDRTARVAIATGSTSELLSRLGVVAVLWAGGSMVLRQQITPGELLSLYALLAYLTGPVGALLAANRDVHDARIAADRLFEVLDLEPDAEPEATVELSPEHPAEVVFEDVSFRYGAGPVVFQGLSFAVAPGKVTAVVGESGSGKSTLVSLLHRTEVPQGGRIRVGGTDLAYVSAASLRRFVSVVPQRVELFSGTVVGNIAFGDLEPDMSRVLEIAGRLRITEFVEKLPRGFMATIGENGTSLSGGQRQRIAVARALYRDPRILVLDEATSALDSASERRIQEALEAFRAQGRTILVIAHRLSTVMHADRIVVLDRGAVAEEGTHAGLLEAGGIYARLWYGQFHEMHPGAPHPALAP